MSNGADDPRADAARIREALSAMLDVLRAAFPALKTVEAFWPFDRPTVNEGWTVITPALILEVESFDDQAADLGDDRTPISLNLAAHCILSTETPEVELEILNFAAAVLRVVRYNRWGLGDAIGPPEQVAAMPSEFAKPKAGYEVWAVVWSQAVYLGDLAWTGEGLIPHTVCLGFAPKIGAAHEPDYVPLGGVG